ncbi:MAG: hypothetical protein QM503_04900 [Bacteroidota bacterium]
MLQNRGAFFMQKHISNINLKVLNKLCKGNETRKLNYLKQFLEMIPLSVQKIKFAIDKGDRKTILKELHYMSPQLVFFGIDDYYVVMENIRKGENILFNELKKQIDIGIVRIENAIIEVEELVIYQSNNSKI